MGVNPLALLDGNINMAFEGGVGLPSSLWHYNETVEAFNQMLVDKTMEFKTFQVNAREELKKYLDQNNMLSELLKITTHERNEARNQVQNLQKQIDHLQFILTKLMPETKVANSSVAAESDSLSDSLFEADTMADETECNNNKYDEARFDELINKKRPFPEKGKLVQAVMGAGPLLQSLMVAGPLPQWKNPPPLRPLQIPAISMKGRTSQMLNQTDVLSPLHLVPGFFNELCSVQCSGSKRQRSQ